MKTATAKEIRSTLENMPSHELMPLILRLARFKKENKELLTYLLFEANDEISYIQAVKSVIDGHFEVLNHDSLYFVKKSLRKILRVINRYAKYSEQPQTGVELLTYFCQKIKEATIPIEKSTALVNLYAGQLKKIRKEIMAMHEDLQYDYLKELEKVS